VAQYAPLVSVLFCILETVFPLAQLDSMQVQQPVMHVQRIVLRVPAPLCVLYAAQGTICLKVLAIRAVLLEHIYWVQSVQEHGQMELSTVCATPVGEPVHKLRH